MIGAGEAGLSAAAAHGRFSVVTVLDRQAPMFRALAGRLGVADRLVSVRGIGVPLLVLEEDRAASIDRTRSACAAAISGDGAQAVVFGCTGMRGFAAPVAAALDLAPGRVIDPLPNAVRAAIAAAETGTAPVPAPERKPVAGFEARAELSAAMAPEATA